MPQYCLVKHRISTYLIDGADSDRNPDRIPVTGTVTFEALLDKGDSVVVTEGGEVTTITLPPIEARITNGEIYHRGEEGVKLFAGGPDTNPERIRYRAKFSNLIAGGKKIELKGILFEAIPGGELTLSMAQPVPGKPYPGYSATIEEALATIKGAVNAEADSIKWERPTITSGTDLNLVLKSGSHAVPSYEVAETLINRPQNTEAVDRAELRVFGSSSGIHQTWTPIRAAGLLSPIMHRRRDNVGTWTPWVRLDDISAETRAAIMAEIGVAAWLKSALTGSENLNDLRTPGMYRVSTYTIANSLPNRPTLKTAINPAILEVKSLTTGQVEQVWTTLPAAGVDAPVMSRRRDNGGVWTPWVRPGAKVTLATGDDLNEFIDDVVLNVRTYSVANSLLNSPKSVSNTSINRAVVTVTSAGGHTSQIWRSLPAAHQESEMLSRHRDSTGAWSEWSLGETDLVDGSTRSHQLHDRGLIRLAAQYSQDATPVWGWSAPPGEHLTIPTHEGSGQAIHPSVLYFPNGWNGWKYWMAHTPYPNFAESHEDPNIVVSNDGTTWQVPAGLTNPLDDQTGRPNPHNSDTHLTMGPDGQMVMSWRMVNRPEGARNQFFWRTSTDGVTWTAKREIWAPPTSDYHSSTVSQSLTWTGSRWRMYFISSTPAPNQLVWVETTNKNPSATSWGDPVTCTFDFPIPRDRDFWHVETQLHNGQWIGIITDGNRGTTGTNGSIYLMRSSDGTAWEVSPVPLVPQVGDRHDSLYKTGFVVSGTGASMSLDVYYSAYDRTSRVWGTWRTKAVYVGGAPKAPLVTQSDLDLRAPVGAIDSLGQRIDGKVDENNVQDMLDTDPRIPNMSESPEWSWAVTDGDSAALGITTSGDTVIPRIDTSTRTMLLDTLGPADALKRGEGSEDYYPWRVADEFGVSPLAIRADGAVDFRYLTPEAVEHIAGALPPQPVPDVEPAAAWAVDGTAATYLPTGQRIEAPGAVANGPALTWDEGGMAMWLKAPDDGPWRVGETLRWASWGSSSIQIMGSSITDAFTQRDVTDFHQGGVGGDRTEHILGRMGVRPWTLAESVTIPTSGAIAIVLNVNAYWSSNSVPMSIAGIHGVVSRDGSGGWSFTRTDDGASLEVPVGTPLVSDALPYRDAATILNLGKNDISYNSGTAATVLEAHLEAVAWLRSLAGHHAVIGHYANNDWPANDGRHLAIRDLNAALADEYGTRFIDLEAYVMGEQVWVDTGITPTASDLEHQSRRVIPPSLASDAMHTTPQVSDVIVDSLIFPHLENLGWF